MPSFKYEAIDKTGKPQKGVVEAATSEEARQRIKLQGLFPTDVREQKVKKSATEKDAAPVKKKKKGGGFSIGGVSVKNLTTFTRQLSTLQDAGLPLLRSLQILEQQQKPGLLKGVLQGVVEEVEGGSSLSEAMAKFPRAFNPLYTKMVAAGEVGGVLDVILQRLSEFMEKAQKLKRKVVGAMIYPIAVITIAVLIVTGIMLFIIPKFQDIFKDFGVKLPGITNMLISNPRDIFAPWSMKGGQRILTGDETRELLGLLDESRAFGPPKDGMRLPDNDFWWTVASCRNGVWGFQAYHYPTDGFVKVKFSARLFSWDKVPIPVNPPRKLEPAELRRDWNAPLQRARADRWMLVVGKDGLRPR